MDRLPTVKVIQPAANLRFRDSCLITHVTGEASSVAQLNLTIDASFLTVPIARGMVVQTECHIGTTGGRFELLSQDASVRSITRRLRSQWLTRTERNPRAGNHWRHRCRPNRRGRVQARWR